MERFPPIHVFAGKYGVSRIGRRVAGVAELHS
jgi:hypothetical protein